MLPYQQVLQSDRANSNTPPIIGILLTRGLTILSAALVPPLPKHLLGFLTRFVAPERAYLPPRLFTASFPNFFSAAPLPNLLVNLLAAAGEVVLVRPTPLLPIPVVFGPLPRPPRPKEPPPPPPIDANPAMIAILANVVNADNNPSNFLMPLLLPNFLLHLY